MRSELERDLAYNRRRHAEVWTPYSSLRKCRGWLAASLLLNLFLLGVLLLMASAR